jgi:hypothetical protein
LASISSGALVSSLEDEEDDDEEEEDDEVNDADGADDAVGVLANKALGFDMDSVDPPTMK